MPRKAPSHAEKSAAAMYRNFNTAMLQDIILIYDILPPPSSKQRMPISLRSFLDDAIALSTPALHFAALHHQKVLYFYLWPRAMPISRSINTAEKAFDAAASCFPLMALPFRRHEAVLISAPTILLSSCFIIRL